MHIMALVSITDAAKLVRKTPATLSRDIEKGFLNKTVLQDGDLRIDTSELLRAYGRQPPADSAPKKAPRAAANDKAKIALLEERNRSLERVIALEAELRRVKDQLSTELRARLADKDHLIKILESKILFLEYDKQSQAVPTLDSAAQPLAEPDRKEPVSPGRHAGWWARLFNKGAQPRK